MRREAAPGSAKPVRQGVDAASASVDGRWLAGDSAFELLADDWDALAAASSRPALCNGFEWGRAWWRTFGGGGLRLFVYACWVDGSVVGIAPFVADTRHVRACSPFPMRALLLLGTGEPDTDDVASEYVDLLAAPSWETEFADRLAQALLRGDGAPRWDVAFLYNQLSDAATLERLLPAMSSLGCGSSIEPAGLRYVVGVPRDWDGYLASVGAGFRAKLRTDRRRLSRLGSVGIEAFRGDHAARDGLARLAALHAARWRDKGLDGAFGSGAFRDFHARLLGADRGSNRGEILVVTLDGRDIAAVYTLREGATVYYYQSGYNAHLAPNVSLGSYVVGLAIERAIETGATRFDLMRGGFQSYKSRYGGQEQPMVHATVFAPTIHGRLARRWNAGVAALRTLRRAEGRTAPPGAAADEWSSSHPTPRDSGSV